MSAAEFTPETFLSRVPAEVRQYFTAGDGLGQFSVHEKYPHLEETLKAPATRAAVVDYLASEEPWRDQPQFTLGAIAYLQAGASAAELKRIHPLLKHPNGVVRLRMYEYMMGLYYPPRDFTRMTGMFQEMLADPDETVRVQAVRWIQGLKMQDRMRETLTHWLRFAKDHGWTASESYAMVQSMLRESR